MIAFLEAIPLAIRVMIGLPLAASPVLLVCAAARDMRRHQ